jgi:hypothetical protein
MGLGAKRLVLAALQFLEARKVSGLKSFIHVLHGVKAVHKRL